MFRRISGALLCSFLLIAAVGCPGEESQQSPIEESIEESVEEAQDEATDVIEDVQDEIDDSTDGN